MQIDTIGEPDLQKMRPTFLHKPSFAWANGTGGSFAMRKSYFALQFFPRIGSVTLRKTSFFFLELLEVWPKQSGTFDSSGHNAGFHQARARWDRISQVPNKEPAIKTNVYMAISAMQSEKAYRAVRQAIIVP